MADKPKPDDNDPYAQYGINAIAQPAAGPGDPYAKYSPATSQEPEEKPNSILGGALRRAGGIVKGIYDLGKPPETTGEKIGTAIAGPAGPAMMRIGGGLVKGIQDAATQAGDQFQQARQSKDPVNKPLGYARSGLTLLSAFNPLATGSVTNINRLEDEGRNKEAIGAGIADIGANLAGSPKVRGVIKNAANSPPVAAARTAVADTLEKNAPRIGRIASTAIGAKAGGPVGAGVGYMASPIATRAVRGISNAIRPAQVGLRGVDIPGGVPPSGPNLPPPRAPYRMRGADIPEPVTVTPRQIAPLSRQLPAANPADIDPKIVPLVKNLQESLASRSRGVKGVESPQPIAAPAPEVPPNPKQYYGTTPPRNLVPTHQRQLASVGSQPAAPSATRIKFGQEPEVPAGDDDIMSLLQKSVDATKPKGVVKTGAQGGHAGGGVSSVEELSRPGVNYTVSKGGQVGYHGKSFAPESVRPGDSHVTLLPDGSIRVNAGQQLTPAQEMALRNASKR